MFSQIHEVVYHGNGGYTWSDVYEMPIWLRRFTFKKIQEYFNQQNEEMEKRQQSMQNAQRVKSDVSRPNIKPDYSFKAPKK